jgi:dTDP-4-dehydrorhamnose reductase
MTILLTGGTGQVGAALRQQLADGEILAPPRASFDLAQPDSLAAQVQAMRPAVIINAAAYTAVDRAETESALAHRINAEAVDVLARAALSVNALLVHYSTDYVFDGTQVAPYAEDAEPRPLNVYGRTKLAGEEAIRASGARHLILRTSWVYSAGGSNFVRTIARLANERDELRVVDDQHGAPTWATDIARATAGMLRANRTGPERLGTYHVTAAGEVTWHGVARAILDELAARGIRTRAKLVPISAADYGAAAPRPANSLLARDKLRRDFGIDLPPWRESLRACMAELPPPPKPT